MKEAPVLSLLPLFFALLPIPSYEHSYDVKGFPL